LGEFSSLSQKIRNRDQSSWMDSQEIWDMTRRISDPTFQRYGITPPSSMRVGEFPATILHKRYKAGGVRNGIMHRR